MGTGVFSSLLMGVNSHKWIGYYEFLIAGFDSVLQTLQSFSVWAFPLPLHRDGLPEYLAEKKRIIK